MESSSGAVLVFFVKKVTNYLNISGLNIYDIIFYNMDENQNVVNPDHRIRYLVFSIIAVLVIVVGALSYLYFSSSTSFNSDELNLENEGLDSIDKIDQANQIDNPQEIDSGKLNEVNKDENLSPDTNKNCQSPNVSGTERIIYIFDKSNCKPIHNAKISVDIVEGFSKTTKKEYLTDEKGVVVLPENKLEKLVKDAPPEYKDIYQELYKDTSDLVDLIVTKDGFTPNGLTRGTKGTQVYSIGLTRIGKEKLIQIGGGDSGNALYSDYNYKQNDSLDLQKLTKSSNNFYAELLPVKNGESYDFKFAAVSNTALEANHLGEGFGAMEFAGQGGGQEILSEEVNSDSMLNLLNFNIAPKEGYKKTLNIKSGGSYVAKTRDGKHYFKFSTFISKDLDGVNYVKMQIFLQRNESNDLTMGPVSSDPILKVDTSVTLVLNKEFGPIPRGFLEIKNIGPRGSKLTFKIKPLSTNIEIGGGGITYASFPENHIKISQSGDVVESGSSALLNFYGNAAGKFEIISNGGNAVVEVKYTN